MISSDGVKLVAKRFSDAAERYDRLAFIQNDIRQELGNKIRVHEGSRILDVGCGTGILLEELSRKNTTGLNLGMDLVWNMLTCAKISGRKNAVLQADAVRLPFKSGAFDLIVSSSAYQWAEASSNAFSEAYRVLKKGGEFRAVLFGRETLREFFESLRESSPRLKKELSRLGQLSSPEEIRRKTSEVGFYGHKVLSEHRQVVFRDLWSLMMWQKSVGVNSLANNVFLGRKALVEAQRYYEAHYGKDGGISVTFEVIWIEAKKTG